ncbi:MAG: putative Ig domain-containing protein [Chromatiaceae bacterium]|nr:putative Ig domain-containing protein [Chromatiaceae bacterium]
MNGPVSADTVLHLCGLQGRNVDPQTGNGSLIEYVCFAGANVPNGVINIEPRLYPNETGAIFPFEEGDAVIDKFEPGKIVIGSSNTAPSITSTPVTEATQGQPYSYDVEATDPDAGDTLTFSLVTAPVGMTIDPASGLIGWTPSNAQVGDNAVEVQVTDSGGLSDTQSFTVTVDDVNEAPSITSTPVTEATQGQPYSYDVEATDPDAGDTLTFSLVTAPVGMTIDPASGLIGWTPSNAQVGDNAVEVQVTDSGGLSDTQSFTVKVDDVNEAPSITSTPVTEATQGQPYSYDVEATDPDAGDTLTFSLVTAPVGMTIDPASGLIGWTPSNAQVGDNAVTVKVTDSGGLSDTQSFTVTVDDVNEAPSITSTPVLGATQGQPYSYDVEATDPDAGDTLTFNLVTSPAGMTIDPASGLINWTPSNAQVGDNAVEVQVTDSGGLSDTQSFTVKVDDVNEAPSITSSPVLGATQDQPYSYDVEATDQDVGDTLTFSLDMAPAGMAIDPTSGLINWTPTNAQVGDNAVKVRVTDTGGLSDTQSFTVKVDDVNEAPSITSTTVTGATQDQPYSYDVDATDPDAGDTLTFNLVTSPAGMTIDPASGLIGWTPSNAQVGDNAVTVKVTDSGGLSDTQSFTVTVDDVNEAPSITSTPVLGATQGQPYSYDVEATDPDAGDTLTFNLVTSPAGMTIDPASGLINWTPSNAQVGDNAVEVQVTDSGGLSDTQSFTVKVDDVNEAPSITSSPVLGATQDQPYSYDVEATDQDVGDTLTFSLDMAPAGMAIDPTSGLINWTPTNAQVGDNAVKVRVTDTGGLSDTQSFTVKVDDVNEAPSITSTTVTGATQDQPYSYDVDATDPDAGDTLTFALDTAPAGMTIDPASGLIEWTPTNAQVGDNAVEVQVTDSGGLSDTQSFTVTVDDVNEAPSITSTPVTEATQGQPYSYDVEATDPDAGDTLTFNLVTSPAGMTIDPASGLINWTPSNAQVGDNAVEVQVTDSGGLSDTQSFTVKVDDVNEAPSITSSPVLGATQDQPYSYDVEATDQDVGDTLTFSLDMAPAGMAIDPTSGLINWTPTNAQVGDNAVKVRVTDTGGLSDTQSFTVKVDDVNEAPSITSTTVTGATQDQPYSYDVDATDPDAGDTLTFALDTAPAGMTIDPASGLIEWTPTNAQVGDNAVKVRVTDTGGLSDTQSFTVKVDDVNEAPSITSTTVTGATQDQPYSYDVDATDPDAGDTLTFALDTAPAGMTIDPASGLIEWTPTNAQVGDNLVTVRVTDSGSLFDTQSFTVKVEDVNEAPSITSSAVTGATQDQPYSYDVEATDPDAGDTLTFNLVTSPAGMTIDPASGLINWTPSNAQVGDNAVEVQVTDSGGLSDTQSFTVTVDDVNEAPSITSTPVLGATQGQPYSYDVEATDPDAGDTLTFNLVTSPAGMTIDPASGLINWTPSNAQVGDNAVEVQVTDSGGLSDTQSFTVTVDDVNEAPSITSTPVLGATQGQPYSYDVEATDPDAGDTLTFNLVTSPAGMTIDPASGLISWTPSNAQVGDNAVEVQVTDSGGLSDTQSFTVTVDDVNEAPVADPGPDQSVFVGDTVTLDGSGSSDVDGDVLSFFWSLTPPSGSSATLSDATLVNPTFEVDLPGTYVAQLIVNDTKVDSAPATVTISTENSAPVSDPGPDQSVFVGDTVTLDGSGSSDVDGDVLSFFWSLTPPSGSSATLSDATLVNPTFEVDLLGTYVAQLIVNDTKVDSAPATVTISTENSAPVSDPGPDQSVFVGDTVTLDGSGSSDVDGDVLSFFWSLTPPSGSSATLSDATLVNPTFEVDLLGTYVAQLIVNDTKVDSAPATVTISTENSAPVSDPGPDQSVFVGDTVTLDGSGSSDVDGDVLSFFWSLTPPSGSSATLSDATLVNPTFEVDLLGTYVAQLIVNDTKVDCPIPSRSR